MRIATYSLHAREIWRLYEDTGSFFPFPLPVPRRDDCGRWVFLLLVADPPSTAKASSRMQTSASVAIDTRTEGVELLRTRIAAAWRRSTARVGVRRRWARKVAA
jgi:hypothetical protein